jgi:hypothetical protein
MVENLGTETNETPRRVTEKPVKVFNEKEMSYYNENYSVHNYIFKKIHFHFSPN